jgi:drug/metabolite transporter (DMT)-like permease
MGFNGRVMSDTPAPPAATRSAPVASPAAALGPWGAFAGCTLIWSSTFLVIRIGNDSLPPLWAAALRLLLAAIVLGAIARVRGLGMPRGAAARTLTAYGVLQFGLNFPLLYWGETILPSGLAAVLFATIPLSAGLFAHGFGLERLTPLKVVAALVGLGGVALIYSGQIRSAVPALPFAAVLAAATAGSLATVLLKRGPRQSPFVVNAWGAAIGFPICLVASFVAGERHPWPGTPAMFVPLLYLTLAGSVGAFVLLSWLIPRWPVARISFIPVAVPMIALVLGGLVRGERLGAEGIAGSLLVVAGAALAVVSDRLSARAAHT